MAWCHTFILLFHTCRCWSTVGSGRWWYVNYAVGRGWISKWFWKRPSPGVVHSLRLPIDWQSILRPCRRIWLREVRQTTHHFLSYLATLAATEKWRPSPKQPQPQSPKISLGTLPPTPWSQSPKPQPQPWWWWWLSFRLRLRLSLALHPSLPSRVPKYKHWRTVQQHPQQPHRPQQMLHPLLNQDLYPVWLSET